MVHNPGGDDCILGGGVFPRNTPFLGSKSMKFRGSRLQLAWRMGSQLDGSVVNAIRLWDPFQTAFSWLVNGGDPKKLHPLGAH